MKCSLQQRSSLNNCGFDLSFLATIKTIKYLALVSGVISIAGKEANFCTRTHTIMKHNGNRDFIREKTAGIRCIWSIICVEYLKEFELIEMVSHD